MMNIRYEHHRCPWGPEVYAICDDLYDGAAHRPLAGVGSTEAEALADLRERLDDITMNNPRCPTCHLPMQPVILGKGQRAAWSCIAPNCGRVTPDEDLFCPECGSGPGEPHAVHCDPERRS